MTHKKSPLRIIDCGLAKYRPILDLQRELRDKRQNAQAVNTVLVLEHEPVITLGARKSANLLKKEIAQLNCEGIDVVDIRRGGGATAHNPGQLVFYPVFDLRQLGLGISEYVRELEQIGIELLGACDVAAQRRKGFPGLWANDKKIASVGVRVSRYISYHGMAINICNELGIFENMVPCGLKGVQMTSASEVAKKKISISEVKQKLTEILVEHFSSQELTEYVEYRETAELA